MNQLTDLPQRYNPRQLAPFYERTSRLRIEATRTLLAAAKKVGARRFVFQSLAFMYVPAGPAALADDAKLALDAPEPFCSAVRATVDPERLARSVHRIPRVLLRIA